MTESDRTRLPIGNLEGEEEIATYNTTNDSLDYEIQPHRRVKKPLLSKKQKQILFLIGISILAFVIGLLIGW